MGESIRSSESVELAQLFPCRWKVKGLDPNGASGENVRLGKAVTTPTSTISTSDSIVTCSMVLSGLSLSNLLYSKWRLVSRMCLRCKNATDGCVDGSGEFV